MCARRPELGHAGEIRVLVKKGGPLFTARPPGFPLTPSSRYSGERVGERGAVRVESDCVQFADQFTAANRSVFDVTRRSPLSPALSPEYREEGVMLSQFRVH